MHEKLLVWFLQNTERAQGVIEDIDVTTLYKKVSISYNKQEVVSEETVLELVATAEYQ